MTPLAPTRPPSGQLAHDPGVTGDAICRPLQTSPLFLMRAAARAVTRSERHRARTGMDDSQKDLTFNACAEPAIMSRAERWLLPLSSNSPPECSAAPVSALPSDAPSPSGWSQHTLAASPAAARDRDRSLWPARPGRTASSVWRRPSSDGSRARSNRGWGLCKRCPLEKGGRIYRT